MHLVSVGTRRLESRHPYHTAIVFGTDLVELVFSCTRCDHETVYTIGKWGTLAAVSCLSCGNVHALTDEDRAKVRAYQRMLQTISRS